MGFQFVHLTTYARKSDKSGRSVGYVLDEAERRPDACLHVETPAPPELVEGMPLDELRTLHDARSADARTTDSKGKEKRIRVDQHTLATIVASHPGGSPEEVARWESLTVAWLKEAYGDRLASVVRHVDEGHPHLHAYMLPDDGGMRARVMHPGVLAKDHAKQESVAAGDDGKTQNAKGDRAYKAAMRTWQDSYWEAVGLPCGLARIGPGRRRLSRGEWQAEQAQVQRASLVDKRLAVVDRADACIERGQLSVAALKEQVAALKAEKAAVIEAAAEAVRQSDLVVKDANTRAAGLVAKARRQAVAIVSKAKKEADRFRGIGSLFGGLVQGILGAGPAKVAQLVREEERERAAGEVKAVCVELKEVRTELRASEKARGELVTTVREIATERDALRQRLPGARNETLALSRRPRES